MTTELALIRDNPEEIIAVFPATQGRIRLPIEPETYVHGPAAGWAGEGFRIADVVAPAIPEGKQVNGEVSLVGGVPTYGLEDVPEPERRRVDKWLIIERVNAAGKAAAADALLNAPGNEFAKFRWLAPIESVFFDDPDTVAMITSLDLDPEVIMAPE